MRVGSAAHDKTMTARKPRRCCQTCAYSPPPEETVLGIVGGGIAHRLDGGDLGERALDAVARSDLVDPGLDVRALGEVDRQEFNVTQPGEGGDIGDGVVGAGDISLGGEPLLVEIVELDRLGAIATLAVVIAARREAAEMHVLAEHRPDGGDLHHQPLHDVVALDRIVRDELAGLLGKIEQNRARFDHRIGRAAGAFAVDDRRDFLQRIDLGEFRRELVALPHVDDLGVVGQFALLEHDEDLLHVRRGQRVEVDHLAVSVVWEWSAAALRRHAGHRQSWAASSIGSR